MANNNLITPNKVIPANNTTKYFTAFMACYFTLSLLVIIGKKKKTLWSMITLWAATALKTCAFCMLATKRHCVLAFVAFFHEV